MTVHPADMQNLISKASEVGRAQQIDTQRSQHQQQYLGEQFSVHVQRQLRHVPNSPGTADPRLETERELKSRRAGTRRSGAKKSPLKPSSHREEEGESDRQALETAEGSGKGIHVDVVV